MLAGMSDMFKNPDMMKSMEEMMKNPEIVNNAMKMMNYPNMMKMFGGLGNMANQQSEENNEVQDESIDVDNDDNEIYEFTEGDSVFITGLKNDLYNNKNGVVECYNSDNNRYNVFIESMDKVISLKAENLLSTTDNVCVEEVN